MVVYILLSVATDIELTEAIQAKLDNMSDGPYKFAVKGVNNIPI